MKFHTGVSAIAVFGVLGAATWSCSSTTAEAQWRIFLDWLGVVGNFRLGVFTQWLGAGGDFMAFLVYVEIKVSQDARFGKRSPFF